MKPRIGEYLLREKSKYFRERKIKSCGIFLKRKIGYFRERKRTF